MVATAFVRPGILFAYVLQQTVCIKIMQISVITERSQHIEVRMHSVRGIVMSRVIKIMDCRTLEVGADCLMKPLPAEHAH